MGGPSGALFFNREKGLTMSAIDVSRFLKKRADELELSVTAIAKQANISRQTWYRLINAQVQQARISTLIQIADVLQTHLIELSYLYSQKHTSHQQSFIEKIKHIDSYCFIKDISYPLNTMIKQGSVFEKKWEIINLGHSHWVSRRFVCIDNELDVDLKQHNGDYLPLQKSGCLIPNTHSIDIPVTAPGEHVILSVRFSAPKMLGTVISLWKMINAQGNDCFPEKPALSCQVRVIEAITHDAKIITKVA